MVNCEMGANTEMGSSFLLRCGAKGGRDRERGRREREREDECGHAKWGRHGRQLLIWPLVEFFTND